MSDNPFDREFHCPKCGSSHFGSSMLSDNSLERLCHGCYRFTWNEREDDKYFRLTRSVLEAKLEALESVVKAVVKLRFIGHASCGCDKCAPLFEQIDLETNWENK